MKIKFPGVKILDRYIMRKFLGTYIFAIALIIVIVVIFDAAEKIDDFIELKAPLSKIAFSYYLNFIPFFINQFSGLFTFIAVIFFTSKMEWQAMKAPAATTRKPFPSSRSWSSTRALS